MIASLRYIAFYTPDRLQKNKFPISFFTRRNQMKKSTMHILTAAIVSLAVLSASATTMDTIGNVRISCLSPILVRIEAQNSAGQFEDRFTFMVVNRTWDDVQPPKPLRGQRSRLSPRTTQSMSRTTAARSLAFRLYTAGRPFSRITRFLMAAPLFPAPDEVGAGYVIADAPRVVPPAWGSYRCPRGDSNDRSALRNTGLGLPLRGNARRLCFCQREAELLQ